VPFPVSREGKLRNNGSPLSSAFWGSISPQMVNCTHVRILAQVPCARSIFEKRYLTVKPDIDLASKNRQFGVMSVLFALISVGLLILMIWKSDKLVALGLADQVYFIVVALVALSASLVLFGVLRSTASYKGRQMGGVLTLSGATVTFILVLVLELYAIPKPSTFSLTVYTHGEHGPQDIVLRSTGEVVLRLGPEVRRELIRANGEAFFPAIPASFRRQRVPLWVDDARFERADNTDPQLAGQSIDITVQLRRRIITGRVQDEHGNPISGVRVDIAGISVQTDEAGRFDIDIPRQANQETFDLDASLKGYLHQHISVVPNSNPVVLTLLRSR